ncbi:MAG: D-2-hydroxyacid dehydrogenase [Bacteroidales bacterium]|nr:D-2-hydroxyacid dehydrogenase [Bacteroidales bacterium]
MANKIVVLDGYVANSGDLSWEELAQLGELVVYDRTPREQVAERAADAFAIFTNKVVIDKELLEQMPSLRFIGVLATGYNNVDVVAARRKGVLVCNVPAYSTHSVVQNMWAHLLNITNETALHNRSVHRGGWVHCQDFSYRLAPIIELAGLTMGIYGLGAIGSEVAKIANAFGMKVIAYTSKVPWQLPGYIHPVEKKELFSQSDVLAICSTLTAENHHFVDADALKLMKPSAIILNAARGGLIDSEALAEALREGRIFAAGIDVMEQEPPRVDDPLLEEANCRITPHIAWQSDVARKALIRKSAENLKAFMEGNPQNVVN